MLWYRMLLKAALESPNADLVAQVGWLKSTLSALSIC